MATSEKNKVEEVLMKIEGYTPYEREGKISKKECFFGSEIDTNVKFFPQTHSDTLLIYVSKSGKYGKEYLYVCSNHCHEVTNENWELYDSKS